MNTAPVPNPWISAIHAYVPGSNKAAGHAHPVKLSSNENPWGMSEKACAALVAAAGNSHRYPDGSATTLRAAIGQVHGLDPDRIVCGTGSDEILHLLPQIYCRPGDSVVHVRHGFMVYPIAAQRAGAVPLAAPDRDFVADVDAILATVRDDTRLVFLANPNNPTGTMISRAEVARLHAGLRPDILLVVDQAYAEYLDDADPDGGLELATRTENVVATRTFSKIYGLGGMRVGWATGPAAVMAELNRIRAPFPISVAGLAAAEAALADQEFVARCRADNRRLRDRLTDAIARLGNHGLVAVPSVANFVLMTCPESGPLAAGTLHAKLLERGYIARWLPGQGLPNALRISVGTEAETDGVIAALTAIAETA
ncbi:MAG: histidinol-phosphate transaminase [Sphingomonadaceae bacterium]